MDIKTFFKKVASTVEREVKSGINTVQKEFNSPSPSSQQQQSRPAPSQPQPQPSYQAPQPERTDAEWIAYFREILAKEFGHLSIRENVPVQELAGDANDEFKLYATRPQQAYKAEWGKPYTFVLYSGDNVKGVILIGKYQSDSNNVKFLVSKMYAKKMRLPFISFYMDAPNEHEYVVNRIKSYAHC